MTPHESITYPLLLPNGFRLHTIPSHEFRDPFNACFAFSSQRYAEDHLPLDISHLFILSLFIHSPLSLIQSFFSVHTMPLKLSGDQPDPLPFFLYPSPPVVRNTES